MPNNEKINKKGRITIKAVAQDAGVSVSAVSKVLRDAYGVSNDMREKVEASIERLGYRPSFAARAMRGRVYVMGVLLNTIENPFLTQVVDGISSGLKLSGYTALMAMGESRKPIETSLIESMIDLGLDGLILVAPQISGHTLERYAKKIPIVTIGHHEASSNSFDTINCDDDGGAQTAVNALIQKGYKDIMMTSLGSPVANDTNVAPMREKGYCKAMEGAGLKKNINIIRVSNYESNRQEKMQEIINNIKRPQAMFCWSDLDAILYLSIAKNIGLNVPEDFAIIGYDNSNIGALPSLNLSSIEQHGQRLGSMAAEKLISRINGRKSAEHILILPKLVVRGSF